MALLRRIEAGLDLAPRHWWTVFVAACELGLSHGRVAFLCRTGVLRAKRDTDGRRWRVDPASVRELARKRVAQ